MVVEGEHGPLPTLPPIRESDTDRRIAECILPHIVDGATLQIGIGSMPAALGHIMAQSDLKDLGMHTEVLSDAYLELARAGKLTNRRKRHFRGKGVFATGFGSQDQYLFWDQDNWQALCHRCHSKKTGNQDMHHEYRYRPKL